MSSLHFVLHSSPETTESLHDKLRDLSSSISKTGYKCAPVFETLGSAEISQCVLSDSHIALLLKDGRVCRTTCTLLADKLEIPLKAPSHSKSDQPTTTSNSTSSSSGTGHSTTSSRLSRTEHSATSLATLASAASAIGARPVSGSIAVSGSSSGVGRGSRASRILHAVTSAGGRPAGVLLGRAPIPSSLVPNDLVEQCLSVLQGKSRSLIIRELQRTNLDVNLAVNNLLSRDDEGDEDDDSQDGYMPGDDLMSLLDTGAPGDHGSVLMDAAEALLDGGELNPYHPLRSRVTGRQSQAVSSAVASRAALASAAAAAVAADDDSLRSDREASFLRLRERRWLDSALREEGADIRSSVERCFNLMRSSNSESSSAKKPEPKASRSSNSGTPTPTEKAKTNSTTNMQNALAFGEQLHFMSMPESGATFCQITAMYSELLVLDSDGKLHQWKWSEQDSYSSAENPGIHHPKTIPMLLNNEKVVGISSSLVRASVWTESSKVAVWPDETLALAAHKLEFPATTFPEFENSSIKSVFSSSLYTCAWLENGSLCWWGVLPTPLRKKIMERAIQKSKRSKDKDKSTSNDIVTGQQVCMKSNPLYHNGALAFNISGSMPKVGQLMAAAWSWSDVCRFQLKKKTPVPVDSKQDSKDVKSTRSSDINFDMPPPPSPASSTCSEQSGPILVSPGSATAKRKRQPTPIKDLDKGLCDEEDWNIKDCVIIEDGKAANPVGRVIKIDGSFAAVKFSNTSDPVDDPLHNVRLLRKDDLQVVRGAAASKLPDLFQNTPRKVLYTQGQILAVSVLENEFHLVVQHSATNTLSYVIYDMTTNQFGEPCVIPAHNNIMVNKKSVSLFKHQINTDSFSTPCDGGVTMLQDGNNTLYPLVRNSTQTFTDPRWFELLPVQSIAARSESLATVNGPTTKHKVSVVALAFKSADIVRCILRSDVTGVRSILANIAQEPNGIRRSNLVQGIVDQLADGGKNILHLCAAMCTPTTNKETDEITTSSLGAALGAYRGDEMVFREVNPIPRRGAPQDKDFTFAWSLIHEMGAVAAGNSGLHGMPAATMWSMPPVSCSDKERRSNAASLLNILCESALIEPCLRSLLSSKNTDGLTPFMQAVSTRAYNAAAVLIHVAKQNACVSGNIDQDAFINMLYPAGSNADDNPFHLLCCNDTCSFTWTGTQHINQDIYECKSCGLTGSLCCCSECARVCHKRHSCKLKVTSPTAYCDCWEKTKCKALIAGNQTARLELLSKLLLETDLVKQPNSKGEGVLLFLVQTVGRQHLEQRQFTRRIRSTVVRKSSANTADVDPAMPEHDLEPPKFAKKALERVLADWTAVKSMLLTGYNGDSEESSSEQMHDDQAFLQTQNGTHLLDKFTHCLLSKCSQEMLDTLLTTLIREIQNVSISKRKQEALLVTRRFVRSVVRVFVVRSVESASELSRMPRSSGSSYSINNTTVAKCRRVFQSTVHIAIQELCRAANAVLLPVTLGVLKPTSAFSLLSASSMEMLHDTEDLFVADPLPKRPRDGQPSSHHALLDSTIQSDMPDRSALYDEEELDSMAREQYEPAAGQASAADGEIPLSDAVEMDMDQEAEQEYVADAPEGESDMDLDLLAESDSDNESVHGGSVHSVGAYEEGGQGATGRNNTTAMTSSDGIHQLAFFSEEDSSLSDEEVDSDEGQDSDQEYEGGLDLDQLERHSADHGAVSHRSLQAPQSMRWAIRQPTTASSSTRPTAGSSSANPATSSGLIYIDPVNLRRSNAVSLNGAISSAVQTVQSAALSASQAAADESLASQTTSATANNLSRAFGIILRQIADLLNTMRDYRALAPNLSRVLDYTERDVQLMQSHVEDQLKMPWNWMVGVMDATEAQLRFGTALVSSTDSNNPNHPMHPSYGRQMEQAAAGRSSNSRAVQGLSHKRPRLSGGETVSGRHGFLSYILSLMRSYNSEHAGCIPSLDVLALKHVAYVFDAMIYYMKSGVEDEADVLVTNDKISIQSWAEQEDDDSKMSADSVAPEDLASSSNRHPFFQRSDSTTFLGCVSPDPIHTPLVQALPLAERPQLLHPLARREEMFGISKQPYNKNLDAGSRFSDMPIHMGIGRHVSSNDSEANLKLDTMGTYTPDNPPQDEPADLSIPRTESSKTSTSFSNVLSMAAISPVQDPGSSGLVPVGSKPTSVIVSNQSLISDTTNTCPPASLGETLTEQTVHSAGNRSTFFGESITYECLVGRWRQTVQMFGHIFCDDVGAEPGSVISDLGGFPVKESKFRREMEKLRNSQQRDLTIELERERNLLLVQTIKQLNVQYSKRAHYNSYTPILAVHRVKAQFKNEPGEGSGVARSFYNDFSRAVLSSEKIPKLDVCTTVSGKRSSTKQSSSARTRSSLGEGVNASSSSLSRLSSSEKKPMSASAVPYHLPMSDAERHELNHNLPAPRRHLGERILPRVQKLHPEKVNEALTILREADGSATARVSQQPGSGAQNPSDKSNTEGQPLVGGTSASAFTTVTRSKDDLSGQKLEVREGVDLETLPLFHQPGKQGYYSPIQGSGSVTRLNAFRNVGRVIGLCLLQNEICPLYLSRPVLKYILGRPIKWHDLAFQDPTLYESLRKLLADTELKDAAQILSALDLSFTIDDELSGLTHELIPGGADVPITPHNIYCYVRKYAYYKMVRCCDSALEQIKSGIHDVIPRNSLDGLYAEDLRLLLNGQNDIDVQTLISYTSFNDESGESSSDKVQKFKRWFWSIAEKMNAQERQDLVYFWTSSPALPASEEGFQPMPTITIRPADDTHLPTANTCISRLYIPLYSSKQILKTKLILAIKTKAFGFV